MHIYIQHELTYTLLIHPRNNELIQTNKRFTLKNDNKADLDNSQKKKEGTKIFGIGNCRLQYIRFLEKHEKLFVL